MGVPYTFSTASQSIPLAQLDSNFATPIVLGSSTAALGQTVTTLNNLTLSNVTILSGSATLNNLTGNVTFGNTTVNLGNSSSSIGNLTLNNTIINSGNISNALIPTANGTVMLSGNMPTFSAYANAAQTITTGTFTKLQCNTKVFDTNTYYDATTNYRFTPLVGGYYQVNAAWYSSTASGQVASVIYKNGSNYQSTGTNGSSVGVILNISTVLFLNGSTDYIEFYIYQNSGVSFTTLASRSDLNYFNACLIRGT